MSTVVVQPAPQTSWKQEVNKRLEAHKSRRGLSVVDRQLFSQEQGAAPGRAAQAAARVAARFSKAPSYSEMQAAEARGVLRTAEAATRTTLEAQAAAQAALASLGVEENCSRPGKPNAGLPGHPTFGGRDEFSDRFHAQNASIAACAEEPENTIACMEPEGRLQIRWDPEMPSLPAWRLVEDNRGAEIHEAAYPWDHHSSFSYAPIEEAIEPIEPVQPIQANLIQFPRELVATRRMRPRLAVLEETVSDQLSIFEVDPATISTDPSVAPAEPEMPSPSWCGPEWTRLELDAGRVEEKDPHPEAQPARPAVHLAPVALRLMAVAVDFALILGLACAGAFGIASHLNHEVAFKTAETAGLATLILIAILYQVFFLLTVGTTPGMMYSRIALCTFDDQCPTRIQLRGRLCALLVSLLPVGLGMAWSLFDEDHLSWHDRLSRTYLRRC